ncbi:MAG: thiol-disulfide isomerase [Gammaproteobacteria bacterium]|nr:thiol-disulfide isomerase [Gammaproteobacteria bacterium]
MNTSTLKKTLIGLAILLWLGAMLTGLWWYKTRFIRPFSETTAVFSGQQLRLPNSIAGSGAIRFVHFWDPACPCNVGNQQHLAEMLERYADEVEFYHLQKPGSSGQLPKVLSTMRHLSGLPGAEQLPASPAVAIWDRAGQLAYFGPYSEGAVCNSSNSFIEPVLDALINNRPVKAANTLAVGCFCDWPQKVDK